MDTHVFSPVTNPRFQHLCAQCGKRAESECHTPGITVPLAVIRMYQALENPAFRYGLERLGK